MKIPRDRGERLSECKDRLEQVWRLEQRVVAEHAAWHARGIASDGSRRMAGARANIKPYPLAEKPAGKLNVTAHGTRGVAEVHGSLRQF